MLSATSAPGLFPVPDLSKRLYTDFLYPDTPIQICVRERYHAVYISQDRKMKFGRLYTFEYVVSFDRICRLQTPDFVILKLQQVIFLYQIAAIHQKLNTQLEAFQPN